MNYILREALDILSRPTNWFRMPNAIKALSGFYLTKWTGRHYSWGYPFMMMIEPTNICNLRCPLCITGSKMMTRADGFMSLDHYKHLIDEMSPYLMHVTLWSQGEPFVNKSFLDMISHTSSKGIRTMTSTNGHFLKENADRIVESGLSTLIVAMDGATQETYEQYRVNGKFDKVYEGMKAVTAAKKRKNSQTPVIELQFIVMKHNEHEIQRIHELASECGANTVSLKTAQVYTKEQADEFLPTLEKYRRYQNANGELQMRMDEINFCRWTLLCPVVNWDGTVSPCCFDKNADYPLGNVFEEGGMRSIWKNKTYANFRRRVLEDRKAIPICTNCSEGLEIEIVEKERVGTNHRQVSEQETMVATN